MKRLFTLVIAAVAVVVLIPGTAHADGTVNWTGNGVTDGEVTIRCDPDNPSDSMVWIFTPGGNHSVTSADLNIPGGSGSPYAGVQAGQGAYQFFTESFDPASLPTDGSINVDFTGDLGSGRAGVQLSHGCAPEEPES
jgi:hypothetical protein